MKVYLSDSDTGQTTDLVVTAGLEQVLKNGWGLDVVRPPQSNAWITVGLGNKLPQEVQLTVHVQATGGADAAHALDDLRKAAEAADYLYVESGGDAVAVRLLAFKGVSGASPSGAYAYTASFGWIAEMTRLAGPLTDDAGADLLTADDGVSLIVWEEEL